MAIHKHPGDRATRASCPAPSLHELQQAFAGGLLDEDQADVISRHVIDDRFPAPRHLQVYRHNVFAGLSEALAAVYPVVQRLVGDGFFKYAADGFIRRHPPQSGNLHDFGGEFAAFLTAFPAARRLSYLPDVARLEWAWHQAFHAGEAPALAFEQLAAVPAERYGALRFFLHPSARLIASSYPILRIWQVNQEGFAGEPAVDLAAGGVRLLVQRRGLAVEIETLETGEHALLRAFADGRPLAPASERALAAEPGFDLATTLRQRVLRETIVHFSLTT